MSSMMKRYIVTCRMNINSSKRSWNCFEHCTIKENRFCYDYEYWSTNVLNSNWTLSLTNSAYSRMIMKFWCSFMWTTSFSHSQHRERKTQRIYRRSKDIFDMRDLNSLNFFLDVRILQKLDTIWLIQNFYMNKLIKNYVINIKYKATTSLSYQSLLSYTDEINQKRVHVYRQKVKSICYSVIIIRSNIIKAASELTRHFINFDSKHLKAANHCIKYLHAIKFLIIRYSNSENEKLSSQISSSNKEKSNKKMSWTSNSKLNKKTSSNKENNDKQIFERTADAFFANDLDRKSAEEYIFKLFDDMIDWVVKKQLIVSIFIIEAKLFSMLHVDEKLIWWIHFFQKLKFDSNQKIMIYNDNLQTIRLLISKILKIETKLRHVDIAQCWLRQSVQSDYFSMNYLFITKMITNELTKILSSQKHRKFINQLRLVDAEFLIKAVECD
jgi:hypothetical protein